MTKGITRRKFAGAALVGAAALAMKTSSTAKAGNILNGAKKMPKTALLLIDVQNDYFPGGRFALPGMEEAGKTCARMLAAFRAKNYPIIHIHHEDTTKEATFFLPGTVGAEFNKLVTPRAGEIRVLKHYPNAFRETNLKEILDKAGIDTLVIGGAMSNMCVDAGTRAAADFGYNCAVAHDACAAMDIDFNNIKVPAAQVHIAFMGALALGYARVATANELLADFKLA